MTEAHPVPPAGHWEPRRYPSIVAKRLVVQAGRGDRRLVASPVRLAPINQPVTDPPSRRVGDDGDLMTDPNPVFVVESMLDIQSAPRNSPPTRCEWRAKKILRLVHLSPPKIRQRHPIPSLAAEGGTSCERPRR